MPTLGPAFDFLEREWAPARAPVRSMLYVGHRGDTSPWWRTAFRDALGGPGLAVIDVQPGSLETARGHADRLILGDVRACPEAGSFGLVFWDEGPEHVPRDEALALLAGLAGRTSVLISCPWGHQPQGTGPDDPEFHHWAPEPEDFASIGMSARCFGARFDGRGGGHGSIVAWSDRRPAAGHTLE